ncbi:hypothetical protein HN592_02875 [Candidatus Woesearchaeota archaeon]|jgi:hypothetical protein|nr:hypothetical protein [Candidatus Woesearchaeota archaeon]MBT4368156.1 hypothetical protein [Candidatus Woesearchaeota archaeon]MBT4712644.1 hypothetical protein [Candidatus Woesearchaeota archaeon]MBT6639557.1 hypothetical protein [Candidatus Woesearchaeota archaeon]MBT7133729.1 hypothetical protein [Candidatus Woesearchaeota archaeon]
MVDSECSYNPGEVLRRARMILARRGDSGKIRDDTGLTVVTAFYGGELYITEMEQRVFTFKGWDFSPKGKKARRHKTIREVTIGLVCDEDEVVFRTTNYPDSSDVYVPGSWQESLNETYKEVTGKT